MARTRSEEEIRKDVEAVQNMAQTNPAVRTRFLGSRIWYRWKNEGKTAAQKLGLEELDGKSADEIIRISEEWNKETNALMAEVLKDDPRFR